jgi:hypothetical protein
VSCKSNLGCAFFRGGLPEVVDAEPVTEDSALEAFEVSELAEAARLERALLAEAVAPERALLAEAVAPETAELADLEAASDALPAPELAPAPALDGPLAAGTYGIKVVATDDPTLVGTGVNVSVVVSGGNVTVAPTATRPDAVLVVSTSWAET